MSLCLIYVTDCGRRIAEKIAVSFGAEKDIYFFDYRKDDIKEVLKLYFKAGNNIVFVSAMGICVRTIAPYIRSKTEDAAVVCIDDCGKFCISVLSGHLGGANELCKRVSEASGAECVITTSTDIHEAFSPDIFAKNNGLKISDMLMCRKLAAASVAGESIGIYSVIKREYAVAGYNVQVYHDTADIKDRNWGIIIGDLPEKLFENTLYLQPVRLVAGIGCRKGVTADTIMEVLQSALADNGLKKESIAAVASIDIKKAEIGLVEASKRLGCELITYSAQRLNEILKEKETGFFSESLFVNEVTGVSNVCETSAAAYGARDILVRKYAMKGVTVAIGEI